MSRVVHTTFSLQRQAPGGGRLGTIHYGNGGRVQTPALFPAICIMTGPPGFGRQGSHYKYIKRIMCREWRHNHFLTEILHFTDYMATAESLNAWLKKPFQLWMDEMMRGGDKSAQDQGDDFDYKQHQPYEACFFLDSGGFKLLSNSDFSIQKFGYETSPKTILDLQTHTELRQQRSSMVAPLPNQLHRQRLWAYRGKRPPNPRPGSPGHPAQERHQLPSRILRTYPDSSAVLPSSRAEGDYLAI
jgi:hypothetical protein